MEMIFLVFKNFQATLRFNWQIFGQKCYKSNMKPKVMFPSTIRTGRPRGAQICQEKRFLTTGQKVMASFLNRVTRPQTLGFFMVWSNYLKYSKTLSTTECTRYAATAYPPPPPLPRGLVLDGAGAGGGGARI